MRRGTHIRVKQVLIFGLTITMGLSCVTYALSNYVTNDVASGTKDTCVATTSDTSASSGQFVQLGNCLNGLGSPTDLDATGTTIADTNYAIPTGAIVMSSGGGSSDSNPGTLAAPVKSLNRAVALAPSPGTIVIRGGVYRDWYYNASNPDASGTIITKDLTFQAYPHEQVWFDGTDVIATSSWTNNGNGTWSIPWDTPGFCSNNYYSVSIDAQDANTSTNSGPCYYADSKGDSSNPRAGDPQMVFLDNTYVHESGTLSGIANSTNFYYDWTNKIMYIGFNPTGHTVEVTKRPQAFVLGVQAGGPSIKGIGFRRYATNNFGGLTSGAVYIGGTTDANLKKSIIENCVFTQNAASGLTARAYQGLVQHNAFIDNGGSGMGSNGHSLTNPTIDNLMVLNNLFDGNNTERFDTSCTISCGIASAIKIAHMGKFLIKGNILENTVAGAGFWSDLQGNHGTIINNVVRGNGGIGIFYEVSSNGIIASNLVYNNGKGIVEIGTNVKIYNNTVVNSTKYGIWVHDDDRTTPSFPETLDAYVYNNIISQLGTSGTYLFVAQGGSDNSADTIMQGMDYNAYYRSSGAGRLVTWFTMTQNFALSSLPLTGHSGPDGTTYETNGLAYSAPTTEPFFVDQANNNYHVRSTSAVYNNGKPLPADVASVLGVPAGTVTSRGALWWPGSN